MVEIVHKRFLSHLSQYLDENKRHQQNKRNLSRQFIRIQNIDGDFYGIVFTVKYISRGEKSSVAILVDKKRRHPKMMSVKRKCM
jgi:hypothetical protein